MTSATARFDRSGSAWPAPSGREDRHAVRVRAEAGARSSRRRSRRAGRRPCGASFSAARSSEPVSAANPTRIGRGSRAPAARTAAAAPARMSSVGSSSSVRPWSRVSFVVAARRGPEVGDGGGHDEGVGARREGRARHRASGPSSRRGRRSRPAAAARDTIPATSVTRAPRSRAASARATPILPVERLPMNRTGSIGSAVPPAVMRTCRPVEIRLARRRRRGRASGRVRRHEPAGHRRPRRPRRRSAAARRAARRRSGRDASGPLSGSTIA